MIEIRFWGAYNAPLCASEVASCFFATILPNPPTSLGPKLSFWARFRCLEVPVVRTGFRMHTMHRFMLPKLRLVFSQQTCPIHFFRPKTMFLGGFARFRCREVQVVISGFGVHKMQHFVLPKLRLVFAANLPNPLF